MRGVSSILETHGYSLADTRLTKTDKVFSGGLDHEAIYAIEGRIIAVSIHLTPAFRIVKALLIFVLNKVAACTGGGPLSVNDSE